MSANRKTTRKKAGAKKGGDDVVFVFSGVVVNCAGCGAEVELLKSELVDGKAPKDYECADCDAGV